MDSDEVWRTIDEQRPDVANLLDELSEHEWSTPSLCAAWTVREVAAHLTLAHMGSCRVWWRSDAPGAASTA
jgi:mycothiol maleylpyruvate isomerase-like protein